MTSLVVRGRRDRGRSGDGGGGWQRLVSKQIEPVEGMDGTENRGTFLDEVWIGWTRCLIVFLL